MPDRFPSFLQPLWKILSGYPRHLRVVREKGGLLVPLTTSINPSCFSIEPLDLSACLWCFLAPDLPEDDVKIVHYLSWFRWLPLILYQMQRILIACFLPASFSMGKLSLIIHNNKWYLIKRFNTYRYYKAPLLHDKINMLFNPLHSRSYLYLFMTT